MSARISIVFPTIARVRLIITFFCGQPNVIEPICLSVNWEGQPTYRFIEALQNKQKKKKKMLWSTTRDSAELVECNYKSIMRCWEQQEPGMQGRTIPYSPCHQVTLHICNPSSSEPPTTSPAPRRGDVQEQVTVSLAQAICCFCFSNWGWRGVGWWVDCCWPGWGMGKWWEALTTNCCRSVIMVGWMFATVTRPYSLTQWPSLNKVLAVLHSRSATLGSTGWRRVVALTAVTTAV